MLQVLQQLQVILQLQVLQQLQVILQLHVLQQLQGPLMLQDLLPFVLKGPLLVQEMLQEMLQPMLHHLADLEQPGVSCHISQQVPMQDLAEMLM
jgi:hypothetical protein